MPAAKTVGVGQDEVDIVRLADVTIVILVPGMGDDVQTIKAGIMEIADIFVINKSDRDGADRVEREIRSMQSLAIRHDGWTPPVVKTVASEAKGIKDLAAAIANFEEFLQKKDLLLTKKISSWRERLVEMLRESLLQRLLKERISEADLSRMAADIAEHRSDPYSLVEEMVGNFAGAEK
jgi:LAO/AO transport system kinase